MNNLPEMTVEKRDINNTHGLEDSTKIGSPEYIEQVQDMLYVCADADKGLTDRVVDVLDKYCPVEHEKSYQDILDDKF